MELASHDPLLNAWRETLARKGETAAVFDRQGRVSRTFAQIESAAQNFSRKIDIFDRGSVLAIQIGNHPDWPALFLACLRKGVVVLPLEQSISTNERDVALEVCRASSVASAAPGGLIEILRRRTAATTAKWPNEPPALLKLTSGTTAAPRAVVFRSPQLLADCNQICATMGIKDVDLNFGVIPISHSYGLSNLLTPLIARGVPLVLSQDRLPRAILVDLARTNATVFPGMPVFYQAFCEMNDVPSLTSLRLCISAGAPLRAALAKKFSGKFNLPIHSFYGSSECGGICYDRDGTLFEDGYVGAPMKDVDLSITDSSQIEVRSAAVADGYFPEPDETKLGHGVFRPDDLLVRCGDGFKIVGRTSDLINVAGKKVNPAQIEAHLREYAGVREAIVFGRKSAQRNEEVAACVVADVDPATGLGTSLSESQLLEFCRARLSGWQVPKRIFLVDEIPVNERGKISRREMAARFG